MMNDPMRVLILDDHATIRSGLAPLFPASGDLERVGEVTAGAAAVPAVLDDLLP